MDDREDDQIDEGPGEHDLHLMDDDPEETVPCARCGRKIWSYVQRCPHCGVHFSGEAWEFRFAGAGARPPVWLCVVIGLIVVAIVFLWSWW